MFITFSKIHAPVKYAGEFIIQPNLLYVYVKRSVKIFKLSKLDVPRTFNKLQTHTDDEIFLHSTGQ